VVFIKEIMRVEEEYLFYKQALNIIIIFSGKKEEEYLIYKLS
jgi:hypothetical protein